jgi:hypothetical protein
MWGQQVTIAKQAAALRRSRNHPKTWHQYLAKRGTNMPRVKKLLPVFGGLLYLVLSVLFGSLWYAALSTVMMRLEP